MIIVLQDQTGRISRLKRGKVCQVKVRAFRNASGKRYNGAWSKVAKSGKIK